MRQFHHEIVKHFTILSIKNIFYSEFVFIHFSQSEIDYQKTEQRTWLQTYMPKLDLLSKTYTKISNAFKYIEGSFLSSWINTVEWGKIIIFPEHPVTIIIYLEEFLPAYSPWKYWMSTLNLSKQKCHLLMAISNRYNSSIKGS